MFDRDRADVYGPAVVLREAVVDPGDHLAVVGRIEKRCERIRHRVVSRPKAEPEVRRFRPPGGRVSRDAPAECVTRPLAGPWRAVRGEPGCVSAGSACRRNRSLTGQVLPALTQPGSPRTEAEPSRGTR